jgi:hypothetical protein
MGGVERTGGGRTGGVERMGGGRMGGWENGGGERMGGEDGEGVRGWGLERMGAVAFLLLFLLHVLTFRHLVLAKSVRLAANVVRIFTGVSCLPNPPCDHAAGGAFVLLWNAVRVQ